jgi:hypothetical protein
MAWAGWVRRMKRKRERDAPGTVWSRMLQLRRI